MNCKTEQKQRTGWRAWIAPVVVSALVFAVLGLAQAFNPALALVIAIAIIVGGGMLLKLL